ncbi:MAG: ATP-binding protein, partial [Deltaproteobacteria bacterium]
DNGIGISPENINKLFEPFFSTKPHGTGLGLSVVSQILRSHKASISVSSVPGKGTTMTVKIPRKQK